MPNNFISSCKNGYAALIFAALHSNVAWSERQYGERGLVTNLADTRESRETIAYNFWREKFIKLLICWSSLLFYLVAPRGAVLFSAKAPHFTSSRISWRAFSWRAFWPLVSSAISWRAFWPRVSSLLAF